MPPETAISQSLSEFEALSRNRHFDQFCQISIPGENWVGGDARRWHEQVFDVKPLHLPSKRLGRRELLDLTAATKIPNGELFSAIMAWGGMNRDFARKLLRAPDTLFSLMSELRGGELSRSNSYDKFATARRAKHLVGLGPSYFTKLIFFLDPKHDGYILDQWSGKSVNLVFGSSLIKINRYAQVVNNKIQENVSISDSNRGGDYEKFCLAVEYAASSTGVTPPDAELRMFSSGARRGVPAGRWRSYVKQHYLAGND